MSDWLQQLSELESKATPVEWFRDGTNLDALPPDAEDQHDERRYIAEWLAPEDADFIAALRNSAQHLIERARRAEELVRAHKPLKQDRSRYTVRVFDGDTPVWDISLSGPELDSERRVAELLQSAANQFEATPNEE